MRRAFARFAWRARPWRLAVLNAANEVAVEAYLAGRIGFLQIAQLVAEALDGAAGSGLLGEAEDTTAVLETDAAARRLAVEAIDKHARN
jgi:1-deoxy-D-xylulose-5-phosphate reductoisomerase